MESKKKKLMSIFRKDRVFDYTTANQIAACLGLTPSQYSSRQKVRMGRITHTGNHRLRTRW